VVTWQDWPFTEGRGSRRRSWQCRAAPRGKPRKPVDDEDADLDDDEDADLNDDEDDDDDEDDEVDDLVVQTGEEYGPRGSEAGVVGAGESAG
jgi:hypothetical protein